MEAATKKKIIFGTTGLVLVVAAYGIYWYITKDKTDPLGNFGRSIGKAASKPIVFPLRKGSRGAAVKQLQKALNRKRRTPLSQLTVDGVFGAKTLAALQRVTGKSTVSQGEYSKLTQSLSPF